MGHVRGSLIAFDLDGTLVDSSRDLGNSVNELLGELGAPALPLESITRMVGEGATMLIRRALVAAGLPEDPNAIARFLEIYDRRLLDHTRPYGGIAEVVRTAGTRARIAVLTNKPLAPTEKILDGLALRHLFDDVIGSGGTYPRKPDPAGLRALMERAGTTAERTLMVGDSRIDYETATNAAAHCCLVTYGFSAHTFDGLSVDPACLAADAAALGDVIERFLQRA